MTRRDYGAYLVRLVEHARKDPATLTAGHVTSWAWAPHSNGRSPAANTARVKITVAKSFLRWCVRHGHRSDAAILDDLADAMRRAPRTYGKAQAPNPARFLTREEVARLITACQDGTDAGLRDELIVRLGVSCGMRASEIAGLTWGNVTETDIRWRAKKHKPRHAQVGPLFTCLVERYKERWTEDMQTPPLPSQPLIAARSRATGGNLQWGKPVSATKGDTLQIWLAVTRRASAAGLGHVSPHDLRRTCASILRKKMDESGKHHFYDLGDIQKVLGHADPNVTVRCYLDPMDTEVFERAAQDLNF